MFIPDSYELLNLYKMYDLDVDLEIIEPPIVSKEDVPAEAQTEDENSADTKAKQEGED